MWQEIPADAQVQIRSFRRDITLSVSRAVLSSPLGFTMEDLYYASERSKLGQLKRTYFNEEELTAGCELLKERIESGKLQSAIAVSMKAGAKSKLSMGHCMQVAVLNHFSKRVAEEETLELEIYYRVTEGVTKFMADLIFFKRVIIPLVENTLGMKIDRLNLKLSNIFFSSMYFPILAHLSEKPTDFLEALRGTDRKAFSCHLSLLDAALNRPNNYTYKQRADMHAMFNETLITRKRTQLRKYFNQHKRK